MDDKYEPEVHLLYIGEASKDFCFDFSNDAAITGGETISSPTVTIVSSPSGSTPPTFATAAVLVTAFTQYDANGKVDKVVAIGEGVSVRATAGTTKGDYTARCLVTKSSGGKTGMDVIFRVK